MKNIKAFSVFYCLFICSVSMAQQYIPYYESPVSVELNTLQNNATLNNNEDLQLRDYDLLPFEKPMVPKNNQSYHNAVYMPKSNDSYNINSDRTSQVYDSQESKDADIQRKYEDYQSNYRAKKYKEEQKFTESKNNKTLLGVNKQDPTGKRVQNTNKVLLSKHKALALHGLSFNYSKMYMKESAGQPVNSINGFELKYLHPINRRVSLLGSLVYWKSSYNMKATTVSENACDIEFSYWDDCDKWQNSKDKLSVDVNAYGFGVGASVALNKNINFYMQGGAGSGLKAKTSDDYNSQTVKTKTLISYGGGFMLTDSSGDWGIDVGARSFDSDAAKYAANIGLFIGF